VRETTFFRGARKLRVLWYLAIFQRVNENETETIALIFRTGRMTKYVHRSSPFASSDLKYFYVSQDSSPSLKQLV